MLTEKQIDLISHSLGVNYYNAKVSEMKKYKFLPDEFYRNYYNYGELTEDIISLETSGMIEYFGKFENNYFRVTENGKQEFREAFKSNVTDKYVPLSKSKARYQDYLEADTGLTYEEFIGVTPPKREYDKNKLIRLVHYKNNWVKGDWSKTLKEAKVSYKSALKASR